MDKVGECRFTDDEIRMINRCRLYLRAECLSDISNAAGTSIQKEAFECAEKARLLSTEDWPRQPRPGKKHRRIWASFVRSLCNDESLKLRIELGEWKESVAKQQWQAYYDPVWDIAATEELGGRWAARKVVEKTRRGWVVSDPIGQIDIDREEFVPCDIVSRLPDRLMLISTPQEQVNPILCACKDPPTWKQYLMSLPPWAKSLIEITSESMSTRGLCGELIRRSNTVYIASDGGYRKSIGAYGWVIATEDEILHESTGPARGHPMSAWQAEVYGKLAAICFLLHYSIFFGIKILCKLKYFCDNTSVLKLTYPGRTLSARDAIQADYDVIRQIVELEYSLQARCEQPIAEEHVRGHQQKSKDRTAQKRQAVLNIRADEIATQTVRHLINSGEPTQMIELPACKAYLLSGAELQTSKELWTSRWKWSDIQIQNYYCRRLELDEATLHRINWEAFRSARRGLSSDEQAFATKLITRWLPTGHRVQKYGGNVTACHRCGADETVDHLFTCKGNKEWQEDFLLRLDKVLQEMEIDNDIRLAIWSGLTKWIDKDLMTKGHRCPATTRNLQNLQSEIGWNLTMCGLFDENWEAYQDAAYDGDQIRKKPGRSGKVWSRTLSAWMIREAQQLWIARNQEVHLEDKNRLSKSDLDTIDQVRNLYKLRDDVSQHDKAIFDKPIEDRLKLPLNSLRQWVKNTIPTANRCIRDFKQKIAEGQTDIRKFFGPRNHDKVQAIPAPTLDSSN